jgi:hypothetical protein
MFGKKSKLRERLFCGMLVILIFPLASQAEGDELLRPIFNSIESGEFRSVEDVIRALPKSMKRRNALVYQTQNVRQAASAEFPRALFFSEDLKAMIAISGDPNDVTGYQTVEVIEFDERLNQYRFSSVDFESGRGTVKRDVAECAKCHHGRPIWDAYPRWAGIFGSEHTRSYISDDEREHIRSFQRARLADKGGRYALFMKTELMPSFYLEKVALNVELTKELSEHFLAQEMKALKGTPKYSAFVRAVLFGAVAMRPEKFVEFLEGELNRDLKQRYEVILKDILRRQMAYVKDANVRTAKSFSVSQSKVSLGFDSGFITFQSDTVASIRLAYEILGIPMGYRGFGLHGASYAFTSGYGAIDHFGHQLLQDLHLDFPEEIARAFPDQRLDDDSFWRHVDLKPLLKELSKGLNFSGTNAEWICQMPQIPALKSP